VALFCFLFTFVATFCASLANLSSINEKCSGCMDWLDELPGGLKGLIEKFLPVIVMIIALALVPGLLYTINSKESWVAYSHITTSMVYSHFYFLWWNLFLVVVLAGSVINELEAITEDFDKVHVALGQAIPTNAIFFSVFTMTYATGQFIKVSNIGGYIVGNIFRKYLCKTDREMDEAMNGSAFDIAVQVPIAIVIFCMTITYMAIAPIICPIACLFFGSAYIVNKFNLLANTNSGRAVLLWDPLEYDGGGKAFHAGIMCTMTSIFTASIFNAFYFAVRESWIAMAVVMCVIPAVLYVWCTIRGVLASGNCLYPDSEHWNVEYSDKNEKSDKRIAKDTMFEMQQIFENQPMASHGGKLGNIPVLTNETTTPVDRPQDNCYYQRPCLLNKDCVTWSYSLDNVNSSISAAVIALPEEYHAATTDEIAEDELIEDPAATLAAQKAREAAEAEKSAENAAELQKSFADQTAIETAASQIEASQFSYDEPKTPEQVMSDESNSWFHAEGDGQL
jgi:hypothetical protein